MKLVRVEVKNFRSIGDLDVALVDGMNSFVGPNNCGKSNLVSAMRMALDPDYQFDPTRDVPGQRHFAFPRTTLTFKCVGANSPERTLLRYLKEYEESILGEGAQTNSASKEVRLVVAYRGSQHSGMQRQEYFAVRGTGDRRGDSALNEKALRQFRKLVRLISVESGQSIEELLLGKFREILHAVLREELGDAYGVSEGARIDYQNRLQDSLLAPMRERVLNLSKRLFPEVSDITLVPAVSSLEETLSNIQIRMTDSVESELRSKGTGVAGGVLIALLRYLSDATKQSLIFALEEPEAFLHPAAQQALRDDLEALAERADVTLFVTSHSPYIVSRSGRAQVVALEKDPQGVSGIAGTALGDEAHAGVLSGLFVDSVVPELLDRYAAVPSDATAVLLVEGETDKEFLRLAAKHLKLETELESLFVIANKGVDSVVAQAVLLKAEASQDVWALFDSDEDGRRGRDLMRKRFGFPKGDVLEYGTFVQAEGAESEWLFESPLMNRFVDDSGEDFVLKSKQKIAGEYRYDFTPPGKQLFPEWLNKQAKPSDFSRWQPVLEALIAKLAISKASAAEQGQ